MRSLWRPWLITTTCRRYTEIYGKVVQLNEPRPQRVLMAEKQRSSPSNSLAKESLTTHSHELKIKSCPRCIHLLRGGLKANIHSTLAYTRCRCHRTWKFLSETPNMHMGSLTNRQLQLESLSSSIQTPAVQIDDQQQLSLKKETKLRANWNSNSTNGIVKPKTYSHLPKLYPKLQTSDHHQQNHPPAYVSTKSSLPLLVDSNNCRVSSQTILPPLATHQSTNVLSSVRLDGSTSTLLSPASSKIKLEKISPKQTTSKLPQIKRSEINCNK